MAKWETVKTCQKYFFYENVKPDNYEPYIMIYISVKLISFYCHTSENGAKGLEHVWSYM
jgi:hypothetical protein